MSQYAQYCRNNTNKVRQDKSAQSKVKQTNTRRDNSNQDKTNQNKERRATTLSLEPHAPSNIVVDPEELDSVSVFRLSKINEMKPCIQWLAGILYSTREYWTAEESVLSSGGLARLHTGRRLLRNVKHKRLSRFRTPGSTSHPPRRYAPSCHRECNCVHIT